MKSQTMTKRIYLLLDGIVKFEVPSISIPGFLGLTLGGVKSFGPKLGSQPAHNYLIHIASTEVFSGLNSNSLFPASTR